MQNCKRCDKLLDDEVDQCPACGTKMRGKRSVWGNFLTPNDSKPDVPQNDTTLPTPQLGQPLPQQFRPAQPKQPNQSKKTLSIVLSMLSFAVVALLPIFRLATEPASNGNIYDDYNDNYVYDWETEIVTEPYELEDDEAYMRSCLEVSYSDLMEAPEIYSEDLSISIEGFVSEVTFYFAGEELFGEYVSSATRLYLLECYDDTTGEYGTLAAVIPYDTEVKPVIDQYAIFYGEFRGIFETEEGEQLPVVDARLCQRAETLIE